MAGGIKKTEIVEADLGQISEDIHNLGSELQRLIDIISKVKPITGLEGLAKVSKENIQSAKEIAAIQKQLIDIEIKLANAVKAEQQAKQAKIRTDTQVINQIKAEQQATNTEIQARIRNAQAIAAEERAKQSAIRTSRLEQQQHTKTNSSFRSLIASMRDYLTIYIGISQATQLIKSIFNTAKTLDALDFAIKKVITDQTEFAQTQQFLSRITDAYGAELITTTERYIKFRAASQQSNIAASETQKIFESVTKTAGVLGLKTDELTGVYLALEQMMSKGKVSTEELRRQLGERLPGAFGIMAKALDVSIPKLDEMLKKGQVLSADALPKFAEQLEIAFGIENVDRVDTLSAAQNRYTIAWQETVKAMQSSNFFISVIESATNMLKGLKDTFAGINEEYIRGKSSSEIYANRLIFFAESAGNAKDVVDSLNKSINTEIDNATKRSNQLKSTDIEGYNILSNAVNNYRGELLKQLNLLKDYEGPNKNFIKDLILQSNSIEILKSKVKELTEVKKENIKTETSEEKKARIKAEKEAQAELKRLIDAAQDARYASARDRQNQEEDAQKDFNDETKRLIKDATEEQKAFTNETISNSVAAADEQKLTAQELTIEKIRAAKNEKDEIEKIQHELTLFMIDEDIKAQQRILDTAGLEADAYEDATARIRRLRLQRGEEEIQFTQQTEEQKKAIRQETMQATAELLSQGLAFSQQIYSQQADRAQQTYDAEMTAAGDSLEYQTLAKRKFEAEDKKIKQRQAIASKLQAVLDASLALALAIATTWKNPFLAAVNIGAATLGLGMALATPIPQFAEGTDFAPSSFIAGEEGSELIKTKSGKMILTPNKATLFSDNSLIGSSIIPHDQTQRMLANMAFNQVREVVDMRDTNKHLSGIEKNTREQKYNDSKGRLVVKRGTVNSIL